MTTTLDRGAPDNDARLRPEGADPTAPTSEADPVMLHRRRGALLLVGIAAALTAAAYLWRAVTADTGTLSWVVALALLAVAGAHLAAWWDARIPLLVADDTGIRLRTGPTWTGLRWDEVSAVRLTPSRLPRRDAHLDVSSRTGRGRPLPLAMVDPADVRALPEALRDLAPPVVEVAVVEPAVDPAQPEEPVARPDAPADEPSSAEAPSGATALPAAKVGAGSTAARWWAAVRRRSARAVPETTGAEHTGSTQDAEDTVTLASPDRNEPEDVVDVRVARADVTVEAAATQAVPVPPESDQTAPPPAVAAPLPDAALKPASDPVIGPRVAEARRRLRLSVDDLADRTRIRPHVLEAIEVDDFVACGGDVYARGHLRVLGRVLGIDADVLVRDYDARYAVGPVTARKVFEAELAGPGRAMRTTTAGPRWSVLVGVVLVLVLLWGLARILVPGADPVDGAGDDAGTGGSGQGAQSLITGGAGTETAEDAAARFTGMGERVQPTRLTLLGPADASTSTTVTVTTEDGDVVFEGSIGAGDVKRLSLVGPATVVADDGSAVAVEVDGRSTGPLGAAGEPARRTLGG